MSERLPPLTRDANLLLEAGRHEARRRAHDEVRLEHVLLAGLARPLGLALVARRGVDVQRLRTTLEARIGELPTVTAYRDSPRAARLSAELTDMFADLGRRHRLLFVRLPIPETDVIVGLLAALARIVDDSKFDLSAVKRLWAAAARIASTKRHGNLLVDHALLALFEEDGTFVEALQALGKEHSVVRQRIDQRLTRRLRSHLFAPLTSLVALASLRANASATELDVGPIVVELLRHASVRAALEAADVNRYDLLFAYAHGRAPLPTTFDRTHETVDVVFHDDSYTTTDFVVGVLKETFGLDDAEARRKMLEVHESGDAVVATLPRDRAMAAVIRARGAARDGLMPLRIEVVPTTQ